MSRKKAVISSVLALCLLFSVTGLAIAQDCGAGRAYTVQSGDWVWRIARSFGLTAQDIIAANPYYLAWGYADYIVPGQVLCIPPKPPAATPAAQQPAAATSTPTAAAPKATSTPIPPACTLGNGAWNPYGIPRFWIASVERGKTVTILTENFPPRTPFEARMGVFGALGIGGTLVGTTDSCKGGAFRVAYTIPDGLRFADQIAIRLDNFFTGYYAFNWFWNFSAVAIP